MKLSTLLEMQRCFSLLRDVEEKTNALSGKQYVECVRAESMFGIELKEHIEALKEIEVTEAA